MPEIFKPIAKTKAINGGNFNTLLAISFTDGAVDEYQDATATPSVMPIKNEPAWLIKMAICKPSLPYSISKIGKPKNEVLLIPPVIINAATDFGGIFFHLPIKIKNTKAAAKIIHATRMGKINLLSNFNSVICHNIRAGIKKFTSSSFKV
jgi:hypothetical protein